MDSSPPPRFQFSMMTLVVAVLVVCVCVAVASYLMAHRSSVEVRNSSGAVIHGVRLEVLGSAGRRVETREFLQPGESIFVPHSMPRLSAKVKFTIGEITEPAALNLGSDHAIGRWVFDIQPDGSVSFEHDGVAHP